MFGFDEWLQSSHALETAACPSFLRGRCSTLSSFRVGSKLGEGAHSKVYHAVHKVSAQSVALKVYGLRVLRDEKVNYLMSLEYSVSSNSGASVLFLKAQWHIMSSDVSLDH